MNKLLDEIDIDLYNAQQVLSSIQDNFQNLRKQNELLQEILEKIKKILNDEVLSDTGKIQNIEWILEKLNNE